MAVKISQSKPANSIFVGTLSWPVTPPLTEIWTLAASPRNRTPTLQPPGRARLVTM